jgi:signal transduction histidine kinase
LLADETLGALTSEQLKSMQVAQTAVGQLENIVTEVLDFSDSLEPALALVAVDLAAICRAAIEDLAPYAAQQHVAVQLDSPPETPQVLANRPALARMLRHLLDNALKFSPSGSTVFISAELQPPIVRLSVQDSGCGIAPPQVSHIFEAFYQVDGAATRRANGLGIGLTVVKKLAEAQGIKIGVESQLGRGSRFYFDLQLAP